MTTNRRQPRRRILSSKSRRLRRLRHRRHRRLRRRRHRHNLMPRRFIWKPTAREKCVPPLLLLLMKLGTLAASLLLMCG